MYMYRSIYLSIYIIYLSLSVQCHWIIVNLLPAAPQDSSPTNGTASMPAVGVGCVCQVACGLTKNMFTFADVSVYGAMWFPTFHQSCAPPWLGPQYIENTASSSFPQCGHHASYSLHPVHLQDPLHGLDTSRLELPGSGWAVALSSNLHGDKVDAHIEAQKLLAHRSWLGRWVKKSGTCRSWQCHCMQIHKSNVCLCLHSNLVLSGYGTCILNFSLNSHTHRLQ